MGGLTFHRHAGQRAPCDFPAETLDADAFEEGKMFDGSSIHGWKASEASDMTLLPDDSTAVLDPSPLTDHYRALRRGGAWHFGWLRPRPTLHRSSRRSLFEIHWHRRHRFLWP